MSYPVVLTLHLFAALMFVGTVFFEVLVLEGVRKRVSLDAMRQVETAIGARARKLMPWVLLVLYGAGIAMGWQHRDALAHPLASSFGTLLSLKILLAVSVFGHFAAAMILHLRRRLHARQAKFIHLSVFSQVILIVLLAKAMFYLHW